MGREDGVGEFMQRALRAGLVLEHVDARGADLAGRKEVGQRVDVVDAAARHVDQDDAVFHCGVLLGAEHADGLVGLRQMHRDEIGQGKKLLHVVVKRHAQLLGALGAAVRVVAHQVHAECTGALGNQATDAAQAEDGQRLLIQLAAAELAAGPLPRMHACVGLGGVARAGKHEAHGLLGGRDDIGSGGVAHDDTGLGRSLDIDVVHAHAGTADDAQLRSRGDDLARDVRGGAHHKRIVVGDGLDKLIRGHLQLDIDLQALFRKAVQTGLRQLLGNQDLLRHAL